MNYARLEKCSVVNGPGIRTTLFVSGCRLNCVGCFNKVAQDFKSGEAFTTVTLSTIISSLNNEYISGLTILGGEPLDVKNVETVANTVSIVRSMFPEKTIWIYSGYTLEELQSRRCILTDIVLSKVDVLVDGPFIEALKDPTLEWRGSSNQQILRRGIDFYRY